MRRVLAAVGLAVFVAGLGPAPGARAATMVGDIDIFQVVDETASPDTTYAMEIEASVAGPPSAKKVKIKIPRRKAFNLLNSYRFGEFEFRLFEGGMTLADFQRRFPQGTYQIFFYPRSIGRLVVPLAHDFPPMPVPVDPVQGATGVSTTPTVSWTALAPPPDNLMLRVDCADGSGGRWGVGPGDSSLVLPTVLGAGQACTLEIEAELTDGMGNDRSSIRKISFTTAP